jgi:hypothetical protein
MRSIFLLNNNCLKSLTVHESFISKGMLAALSKLEEVCTTRLSQLDEGSTLRRFVVLRSTIISENSRIPYSVRWRKSSSNFIPEQKSDILMMGVPSTI